MRKSLRLVVVIIAWVLQKSIISAFSITRFSFSSFNLKNLLLDFSTFALAYAVSYWFIQNIQRVKIKG